MELDMLVRSIVPSSPRIDNTNSVPGIDFVNHSNRQMPELLEGDVAHMDALAPGTMLGEFEILGLLGVGGFGMVYRAYDHSLDRVLAIKEYMPVALVGRAVGIAVSIRSTSDEPSFSAGLKSFMAEARLLAQFDHPSLVNVYRVWEANNTAYMAMPLYLGMTLKQARNQMHSPPQEAWLRKVIWSVLQSLKILHESNILHRDVSPDNIFLQDVGPPVLLDLGSARRAVLDSSQKLTALLKINYAPIEQHAEAVDMLQGPWTDLYSLAAVVHGCLCNASPLPATFRVLRDGMPKMASVARTVKEQFGHSYSTEFVTAIQHALAIQPGDRPQSIDGFMAEMQLKHPGDMSRFDWRAEIGDEPNSSIDLQLQMPEPGQPEIAGMVESTIVQTQTREPTQPETSTVVETTVVHTITEPGDVSTHPGKTRNIGVLMLVAAVLLAAWWVLNEQFGTKADRTSNTALVTKDPAPALTLPSADLPVVVQPGSSTVSSPALVSKPASSPIHRRHPLDIPSSTPAKTEPPGTKPVYAATMQTETVRDQAAQVTPIVLCAESNFLTRSMCIYQECQKPMFADLAVCVENRRKYPANEIGVDRR